MNNETQLQENILDNEELADRMPGMTKTGAADYEQGMFASGNNRTAQPDAAGEVASYNRAAHTNVEATDEIYDSPAIMASETTYHSRDGSDAVGTLDEDGGSLGGTEDELDSLEAGGTPVDRNPRMKE